ncbi:MAG: hypothetical protein HY247_00255 [archaeon]|nr:MAG: hypothetical protein HY247_00255 [archaeon]
MTNRSLVLLSGEGSTIPAAEAKALFFAYDPQAKFEEPEPRVLLSESDAAPDLVSRRVAFSRRVGRLLSSPGEASEFLEGRTFRFRSFDLSPKATQVDPRKTLEGIEGRIDLRSPDFEITLVRGRREYLALTRPMQMLQDWSLRRPRKRAFFHPSAIFPKLSRALFNLTRCTEGQAFVDPFCGTGSIPLEAFIVGARVLASDRDSRMTRGGLANMRRFDQQWEGVIRCDAMSLPLTRVDAVATDIPYGRLSSTRGSDASKVAEGFMGTLSEALRPGGRAVVMHPQQVPLKGSGSVSIDEEHHLYVHKLLTRTITVLRRS